MKTYCLYHANCSDGFGAAWAMNHFVRNVEYIPVNYDEEVPPLDEGSRVYLVDFCYPDEEVMRDLCKFYDVTVLDHHDTSYGVFTKLFVEGSLNGVHDNKKSGAVLAWEWFAQAVYPDSNFPMPVLLEYVQDRDLWRKELPFCDEVAFALQCTPKSFAIWDQLVLSDLINEGKGIKRYFDHLVDQVAEHAHFYEMGRREADEDVGIYQMPCVEAPKLLSSEVAGRIARDMDTPMGATYYRDARLRYHFSVRSNPEHDEKVHVGNWIKAKFSGGGGHPGAGGFVVDKLEDL